jgi:hypothetical protein
MHSVKAWLVGKADTLGKSRNVEPCFDQVQA